jgi:hypothetical protein
LEWEEKEERGRKLLLKSSHSGEEELKKKETRLILLSFKTISYSIFLFKILGHMRNGCFQVFVP